MYEPRHRDAYRLFCRLISSGESASPFCARHMALLAMMESEDSFEELRELVSIILRRQEASFTVIGKLAAKDSFRKMFRQLLHDGRLLLREEDASTRRMMKLLHAEFAYQEGSGPKPLVVVEDQEFQGFPAILEEDERVFQSLILHEPDSDAAKQIEDFFAKHPSGTWKQASEALSMPVQTLKRLRKKAQSGPGTASVNFWRELKTSMSAETLRQTAYTRITFASGTKAIITFEPSIRGHVLWSERLVSHPFPAAPADMDAMLQSKWSAFAESKIYRTPEPETVLGRLLHGHRGAGPFGQAESQGLYSHDLQRELYELACPWYNGGRDSVHAAQRIKNIGQELYEMGEDALCFQDSDVTVLLSLCSRTDEERGRLPDGFSVEQFANVRRVYGCGHAAMSLLFIGIGMLAGVFDEVTKTTVQAAQHGLPATKGDIVEMHHTKHLRGELEITGWQCVVEMLWHGIGPWEN